MPKINVKVAPAETPLPVEEPPTVRNGEVNPSPVGNGVVLVANDLNRNCQITSKRIVSIKRLLYRYDKIVS